MVISLRTPEGEPNRCPVCRSEICIEPSRPFGHAPCPSCRQLLWFVNLAGEVRYFEGEQARSIRERLIQLVSEQLGLPPTELRQPTFWNEPEADSIDLVELAMELEDASGD